jgi:hypothetical protein
VRNGAQVGASLGVKIAQLGSKVREESLVRSTPALVKLVSQVAEAEGRKRADALNGALSGWLEEHASSSPLPSGITSLFGKLGGAVGFAGQQVLVQAIAFGVGFALSATLTPWFNDMTQAAWRLNPSNILTPEQLALAVLKGNMDQGPAAAEALSSGVTADRFQVILDNTGEPISPGELLTLWRRGKVSDDRLEQALRQSRVRNEWFPELQELGIQWPSWSEFLDAYLEGQVEEGQARALYAKAGGDPELFELLFNTRGQAPTPNQALDLLNRGIIAERGRGPEATSYEQAFLEGPWRNKWLDVFLALRTYIVPPRSVRPMVAAGAWTVQRGMEELAKSGVPSDTAQAILEEATAGKLATEKDLVKADLLAAYRDGLMEAPQAEQSLQELGYDQGEAQLILAIEDHRWEQSFRTALVTRIRTLYTSGKITEEEAQAALAKLGLAGKAAAKYLALWDAARETPYASLTESQVRAAAKAGIVTPDYYRSWLTDHGYTPDEADILARLYKIGTTGGA